MKQFIWDETTRYEDIPKVYRRLIPSFVNLDALDKINQMDHIRYRVQHEIDITDEEGAEETMITLEEYRNAKRFLKLTAK